MTIMNGNLPADAAHVVDRRLGDDRASPLLGLVIVRDGRPLLLTLRTIAA